MSRKIRWGILSTARIGEGQVIPAIQQSSNGEVTAVGSRNLARGQEFAQRLNIPKAYGSYEELIADPEIDAIYNPLPNSEHAKWSILCAEAGKPVLCEKPLASNGAEAQQMADAFARHGVTLEEAFMYRFHPQTKQVKKMVDDGAVGKVHFVQSTFNFSIGSEEDIRLSDELAGGGLMDVGCYCLNTIRYIVGEEPIKVHAFGDFGARSKVDERLTGILEFPSGVLAHFDCSVRTHFTQTYEIRGSHGRIFVESAYVPFRPDPNADTSIRFWSSVPAIERADYEVISVPKVNHYVLMVEDFADAILNNRAPYLPIQDAIANMQLIDRLLESARG